MAWDFPPTNLWLNEILWRSSAVILAHGWFLVNSFLIFIFFCFNWMMKILQFFIFNSVRVLGWFLCDQKLGGTLSTDDWAVARIEGGGVGGGGGREGGKGGGSRGCRVRILVSYPTWWSLPFMQGTLHWSYIIWFNFQTTLRYCAKGDFGGRVIYKGGSIWGDGWGLSGIWSDVQLEIKDLWGILWCWSGGRGNQRPCHLQIPANCLFTTYCKSPECKILMSLQIFSLGLLSTQYPFYLPPFFKKKSDLFQLP